MSSNSRKTLCSKALLFIKMIFFIIKKNIIIEIWMIFFNSKKYRKIKKEKFINLLIYNLLIYFKSFGQKSRLTVGGRRRKCT
jgi:hypothetical protein